MAHLPIDLKLIRAAATDAGNRWMRLHPEERPEGTATWTQSALDAATAEFHRLCRAAGIAPYSLPKGKGHERA
jgi:hypothetical protein